MVNFCGECALYDINGPTKWGNEKYCKKKGKYYPQDRVACEHFLKRIQEKNGFHQTGCYITTIVCNILGYPDNCDLLETLREFREKFLKQHQEYIGLLMEYDQIGPIISQHLENDIDSVIEANQVLNNFLLPTYQLIKLHDYEKAVNTYQQMALFLKLKYYLLRDSIVDHTQIYSSDTLGKGRIRLKES